MALIEMDEIFDFIGSDFRRPFIMGNELVRASHIFDVRIKKNSLSVQLFALCLSMSNVNGPPHQLRVQIENKNSSSANSKSRSITGLCSCKAGKGGKCKHVTALLLKAERMSREDVEGSTCTELPQKWGKTGSSAAVQEMYQPVPMSKFCCLPQRKRRRVWNGDLAAYILDHAKEIIYEGCDDKCMVRVAEKGRGTSATEDNQTPEHSPDLVHIDPSISYIFSCVGEENISCGSDDEFIMAMPQDILQFYLTHISVSLEDIKKVYSGTVGQNNFRWRKERQVSSH